MSQPNSNDSNSDPGVEGGISDDGSPTIDKFRERDLGRKRRMFRRFAEGAAFEAGKEVAKDQHLGQRLLDLLDWLSDSM